jgi:hypothetical protein
MWNLLLTFEAAFFPQRAFHTIFTKKNSINFHKQYSLSMFVAGAINNIHGQCLQLGP